MERERLRQAVQQYGGDRVLLELDDEALDGALLLTARQPDGSRVPTLTGLLLVGRETSLRQLVPTHELAFQVLAQQAVRFNEFRRFPLLKALDWLETNFRPYNPEEELQVGLFRVPVPKVDMGAFREAVANALVHRDYHGRGAVHVRLEDDALVVSNPGGLVDGVTLANLLVTEPRPRNPALADAMKRIGIVERSGRGVDKIYRGLLKFGRPAPDYGYTNAQSVVLRLPTSAADLDFCQQVLEQERRTGAQLPIDSLIALTALRSAKRVTADELAKHIQRDAITAKRTLEALTEAGLVEAHGTTRGRSYTLSAGVYQASGEKAAYTRQAGFSPIQHEQMVLSYVQQHGQIRRAEVMELCRISTDQAAKLLKKLKTDGTIIQHGKNRGAVYTFNPKE
ncbi:Sugar-specific transcriptional regulator TrmB [compost metagenome]